MGPKIYHALHEAAGRRFILLSTQLFGIDLEGMGVPPESVFGFDDMPWLLFWLYTHPKNDPVFPRALHFQTTALVRALQNYPSATVIVDTGPQPRLSPDKDDPDILGFLRQDPQVREALKAYAPAGGIDACVNKRSILCRFIFLRRQ